jgi:CO/xanthine dehydrogenase Mo-binding subunit
MRQFCCALKMRASLSLPEPPMPGKAPILTRRRMLVGGAVVAGGGLVLSLLGEDDRLSGLPTRDGTLQPNAYLQVTPGGSIILQVDKVEMGQGVMAGFATLLAEELCVRPDQVAVRHAPIHPLFQDPSMVTGDSNSMRSRWLPIRRTGAAAREMLRTAAARRWQVPVTGIEMPGDGSLLNAVDGAVLSYGEVAAAAASLPVPEDPPLREPGEYRWIGEFVARPDIPEKVTGSARFGSDVRLPGQLTAVILRPPRVGDRLEAFDASAARRATGVVDVVETPLGLAVLAESYWYAQRAVGLVKASWSDGPLAGVDKASVNVELERLLDEGATVVPRDDGDAVASLAERTDLEAHYGTPFLAHATMETMNATVRLSPGKCELWVPTQVPDGARELACQILGLKRDQVEVHTTYVGGGFGRRALADYVREALEIARRCDRPVQLIWPREDDTRFDYFRSATRHRLTARLDADGRIEAWRHHLVAPIISQHLMDVGLATVAPEWMSGKTTDLLADWLVALQKPIFGPWQAGDGAQTLPYSIPNVQVEMAHWQPEIRLGIWRAVGNSYNAFVVESFIDELAAQAGLDPAEFRRRHLGKQPRLLAVLEKLVAAADWGRPAPGRFQGIALHPSFGSLCGHVAEISLRDGDIQVHRVTCVIDCGTPINPDVIRAQMESGIIFGLTAALHGQIDFVDGRVRQSNFHDYRMLKLAEVPEIDVHIIPSLESPGGVGETGLPPIAPAVANAVFAATGQRLRELPLRLST